MGRFHMGPKSLQRDSGSLQALLLPPLFLFDMGVPAFRKGGVHLGDNVVNRHLIKKKKKYILPNYCGQIIGKK